MYLDGNVALPGASRIFLSLFLSITLLSFLLSLLGPSIESLSFHSLPLSHPSLPSFPPFLSSCNALCFYILFFVFFLFFIANASPLRSKIKSSMNHSFPFFFIIEKISFFLFTSFFTLYLSFSSFLVFFIFLLGYVLRSIGNILFFRFSYSFYFLFGHVHVYFLRFNTIFA